MEQSEQEAIKNLNDMSNTLFNDCFGVNLKILSNNLFNMQDNTSNYQKVKQECQKDRKSQKQFTRPLSQQKHLSINNQPKRHSISIHEDLFSTNENLQIQTQQQSKILNRSLNCSPTQISTSIANNNSTFYPPNSILQGNKKINQQKNEQNLNKATEFLSSLITPAFQQRKKDHYELLIRLREKERINHDNHQELILYGNSQQVQENSIPNIPKLNVSASNSNTNEVIYQNSQNNNQQQTTNSQNKQCRISVSSLFHQQQNKLTSRKNSSINMTSQEQRSRSKSFNQSTHSIQRVFDETSQNPLIITSQIGQQQIQNDEKLFPYQQLNSFRQSNLIENSHQFLIRLKNKFSKAASCYRKKAPLQNDFYQQREIAGICIPNPKNIHTKSQGIYDQISHSTNSDLQMLQIVPTPQSTNFKNEQKRKMTISSQSEAGIQILEDQLNQASTVEQKQQEISNQEQIEQNIENNQKIEGGSQNQSLLEQNQDILQVSFDKKCNKSDETILNSQNIQINYVNNNLKMKQEQFIEIESYREQNNKQNSKKYVFKSVSQQRQSAANSSEQESQKFKTQKSGSKKKINKNEQELIEIHVIGNKMKQNNHEKQIFSQSQNKENYELGEFSNRSQFSVSIYGDQKFTKDLIQNGQQPILSDFRLNQSLLKDKNDQNTSIILKQKQYKRNNQLRASLIPNNKNVQQSHHKSSNNNNGQQQINKLNSSVLSISSNIYGNQQKIQSIQCDVKKLNKKENLNKSYTIYDQNQIKDTSSLHGFKILEGKKQSIIENDNKYIIHNNENPNRENLQNINITETKDPASLKNKRNTYPKRQKQRSVDFSYSNDIIQKQE